MKKLHKQISSLLLGTALAISSFSSVALAAESSITYEGGAEKFVFLPGSEYTDTDLFENFKNVMPGDSLEQKITIKNDYKGSDYVKIYMRAELHDETDNPMSPEVAKEEESVAEMNDFLSQLSMEIALGDKVIYQASPDQLDGLAENVLLGSFRKGVTAELTVKLNVPIEMDNKYANRISEVDWVFTVEERNTPSSGGGGGSSKTDRDPIPEDVVIISPEDIPLTPGDLPSDVIVVAPKTGDDMNVMPYVLLLGAGIGGMFLILFGKRKKEENA